MLVIVLPLAVGTRGWHPLAATSSKAGLDVEFPGVMASVSGPVVAVGGERGRQARDG